MTGPSEIVRLAARGDGVTADGRHMAFAAPGDRIADNGDIVPGPNRQTPPCRHFGHCGGCQLQHIDDAAYAAFLTARIAGALGQHGLSAEIQPAHLSPPAARRRAAMRAIRAGKSLSLGFAEAGSHRLIDLRMCPILHPELFAMVAPLRALLGALLPDKGLADVRLTLADQGIDLLIEARLAEDYRTIEALGDFAREHRLARLALDRGGGSELLWEPEPVTITLGGVAVALPPAAFLQATADGEAALTGAVLEIVRRAGRAADLFSGLGTFALPLARAGASVLAVEGARDPIAALTRAAALAKLPVKGLHRDLFRRPMTAEELAGLDAIVLDPPRAGASAQVVEIGRVSVPVVAMVSCNPATFARDARTLVDGGYRLGRLWPVGQFRWSTHVELVAELRR